MLFILNLGAIVGLFLRQPVRILGSFFDRAVEDIRYIEGYCLCLPCETWYIVDKYLVFGVVCYC